MSDGGIEIGPEAIDRRMPKVVTGDRTNGGKQATVMSGAFCCLMNQFIGNDFELVFVLEGMKLFYPISFVEGDVGLDVP